MEECRLPCHHWSLHLFQIFYFELTGDPERSFLEKFLHVPITEQRMIMVSHPLFTDPLKNHPQLWHVCAFCVIILLIRSVCLVLLGCESLSCTLAHQRFRITRRKRVLLAQIFSLNTPTPFRTGGHLAVSFPDKVTFDLFLKT